MAEFSEFKIKRFDRYSDQGIEIEVIEIEDESLLEHVQNYFNPEDVFEQNDLEEWAKSNEYIKEQK